MILNFIKFLCLIFLFGCSTSKKLTKGYIQNIVDTTKSQELVFEETNNEDSVRVLPRNLGITHFYYYPIKENHDSVADGYWISKTPSFNDYFGIKNNLLEGYYQCVDIRTKSIVEDGYYKNGLRNGNFRYFTNGVLTSSKLFNLGVLKDEVEFYRSTGCLKRKQTFVKMSQNDTLVLKTYYHESGFIWFQGFTDSKGRNTGFWEYFNPQGELIREVVYLEGKIVSEKNY